MKVQRYLENKVAVVTGSTKGIGEGIAKEMADEGARVIVTGRDVDSGKRVVEEIREAGGDAAFFKADLGEEAQCIDLLNFAVKTYGALHVLVNNHAPTADILEKNYDARLGDTTSENWEYLLHNGLTSIYYMLKHALPIMLKNGGGSIVNISSAASEVGVPGLSIYSATKGGVNALTRNIAADYGQQGIRCNTIIVGLILNNPTKEEAWGSPAFRAEAMKRLLVPRYGYPADIAAAAVYFASDKSGYVTGQALRVDGGITMKWPVNRPDFSEDHSKNS